MQIPEIKTGLPLARVLSDFSRRPDGRGRMRCPFHDGESPSMRCYPETGTVYRFAASCRTYGRSLDAIDIIRVAEGCTKHEAIVKPKVMAGTLPKAMAGSVSSYLRTGHRSARRVFQTQLSTSCTPSGRNATYYLV